MLLLAGLVTASAASARAELAQEDPPRTTIAAHIDAIGSADAATRTRAARLIRRTPAPEAVPALAGAVRTRDDEDVRSRALVLLTGFNDRGLGEFMEALVRDRHDRVRQVVYRWLERHPRPATSSTLIAALETETSESVRPALLGALAVLGDDPLVQLALAGEIGRGLDVFQKAVVETLGRHRATYALDAIANVARQPGPVQFDAVLALGRLRDARARPVLEALAEGPPDIQPARSAALCFVASLCETHLADLMQDAVAPDATSLAIHRAAGAFAAIAIDDDDLRVPSVLFELAGAGERLRGAAARAFGLIAIGAPELLIQWLDRVPDEARARGYDLVKDAFDRIDDDVGKERFFTALRAAHWSAPDGSTVPDLAAALMERLEF